MELVRPEDYVVVHVGEGRGAGFEFLLCLARVGTLLDVVIAPAADWTSSPAGLDLEDVWYSMSSLLDRGVTVRYEW